MTISDQCTAGSASAPDDVTSANARLLAAAPEMLGVLKVTAGNIRSLGPAGALDKVWGAYEVWLRVVEDAIRKAEGA